MVVMMTVIIIIMTQATEQSVWVNFFLSCNIKSSIHSLSLY